MFKPIYSLTALAVAVSAPLAAHAADNKELTEIREQIKLLKDHYESRIQALESRLKETEAKTRTAEAAPEAQKTTAVASAPAQARQAPSGNNTFNPAVSLVLQGRYANLSQDPNGFAISGFIPGGEIGPGERGFSLSETELTLSANVDDKFYGQTTFAVTPEDEIEVEEAYIRTSALPAGFSLKAGRFFSGIGYQNEQHAHAWDFVDAPLAYQAFFGGQFGNDGVQLKWVAPTDLFLELGAEAGNGANFPGTSRNKNGANSGALTAKLGGDIGSATSWRVGVSGLRTHAENREHTQTDLADNDAVNSFTGKSRIAIADFVLKYAPNGNPLVTNFKLQGEYFRRKETGDLTYDSNGELTLAGLGAANTDAYRSNQSGWYLQGIYQFMPQWRVGVRYDRLNPGTVDLASNAANLDAPGFKPNKSTIMFDWNPSEFSIVRLQAARDRTQADATDNQIFLQYIMTLGAHGAHKF
ncbi:MAG TPA: hypothetical protein VM532_01315 [Burkholderiales bacterium]|nr:hypothetical protein [Burkholderiales bacterium]